MPLFLSFGLALAAVVGVVDNEGIWGLSAATLRRFDDFTVPHLPAISDCEDDIRKNGLKISHMRIFLVTCVVWSCKLLRFG